MRVFISSNRLCAAKVGSIVDRLTQEGIQVSLPEKLGSPGESWVANLLRAIVNSDAFIVVISKATIQDQKQTAAIALWEAEQEGKPSKPAIPVLLDEDAVIPFLLRDRVHCDLSNREEFDRKLRELVAVLRASIGVEPIHDEVVEAKNRELKALKAVLAAESKEFDKERLLRTRGIGAMMLGILVASLTVYTVIFLGATYFKGLANLATGAISGVGASILGAICYRGFQEKDTRKEAPNGG